MRKLIVSEFVTLDGIMQAPGGKDEDPDGGLRTAAGRCRIGTITDQEVERSLAAMIRIAKRGAP